MKTTDRKHKRILTKRQEEKYINRLHARNKRTGMSIVLAMLVLFTTIGGLKLPAITLSVTDADQAQFTLDTDHMHQTMQADGDGYHVSLEYTEEAGIPEGAGLQVLEIAQDSEEYSKYLKAAGNIAGGSLAFNEENSVNENISGENNNNIIDADNQVILNNGGSAGGNTANAEGVENSTLEQTLAARFFDISIVSGDQLIEPAAPVSVKISLDDFAQTVEEDVNVVHFKDDNDIVLMDNVQTEKTEGTVSAVTFDADSFSVYGVLGTAVIEKNVLASDGHNYRVTVTYGPETGIPEDVDLSVTEVLPEDKAGQSDEKSISSAYGMSYEDYVASTENALGMEEGSAGYIRLFDIKIVDRKDHSVKYQPKEGTSVDVRIELTDASDAQDLNVVHFADGAEEGDKIDAETEGQTVSFVADGFSVYAIVDGDQSTGETYSIKYTFVLDDGNDTPFYFTNKNGDRTNVQYVKDGEIPYNPGTPTASTGEQADKEFAGWWTKNGLDWEQSSALIPRFRHRRCRKSLCMHGMIIRSTLPTMMRMVLYIW